MTNKLTRRKGDRDLFSRPKAENPFSQLQQEMNRMFDNFWVEPFGRLEEWSGTFVPAVNVIENDKDIRVLAELPGLDEKDIDVAVSDSMLTIQGEKKQEEEQEEKGFYRRESSYGRFRRVIYLPSEVDENKAKAEFKKGILKIELPKTEQAQKKAKKIKIKST